MVNVMSHQQFSLNELGRVSGNKLQSHLALKSESLNLKNEGEFKKKDEEK